jgi:hypothetical protein
MNLNLPDPDVFDVGDEAQVTAFIRTLAPSFLVKPGQTAATTEQIEQFKKAFIFKCFANQGKNRVESLKALILKAPKSKQQALLYILAMMGIWDGLENTALSDEEEVPSMTDEEIVHIMEWFEAYSLEAFEDNTLSEQIKVECAIATSVIHHALDGQEVMDVRGLVVYQDQDFVIVNTDTGDLVALDRSKLDDVGVYRGSVIYAQLELSGNQKGMFKLLPPGIVLER